MADLLIRASSNDAVLLRRVFGFGGHPRAAAVPNRIVVDAHTVARTDAISDIARRAGVPFLVDPQTYLLQDPQHDGDKWSSLPFADPAIWTPGEALSPTKRDALIRESINHQVTHGATSIIAPYFHLEKATSGWIDVQAQLWLDTRRYLDKEGLALPVIAVLAPGWRLLHPIQGQKALAPVFGALETLTPQEVALAASRVAAGVDPGSRLMDLVLMIERLKSRYPLITWQQGVLGEACIAAGAIGYQTGIGWRETCDLQNTMAQHRKPSQGFSRPPVYVPALGRSIPARTLEGLRSRRSLWTQVICTDSQCCPPAGSAMLGDARAHAIISRAKSVHELTAMPRAVWRWKFLAGKADKAKALADQINRMSATCTDLTRIDTAAIDAIRAVAHQRRLDYRSRRVA